MIVCVCSVSSVHPSSSALRLINERKFGINETFFTLSSTCLMSPTDKPEMLQILFPSRHISDKRLRSLGIIEIVGLSSAQGFMYLQAESLFVCVARREFGFSKPFHILPLTQVKTVLRSRRIFLSFFKLRVLALEVSCEAEYKE